MTSVCVGWSSMCTVKGARDCLGNCETISELDKSQN